MLRHRLSSLIFVSLLSLSGSALAAEPEDGAPAPKVSDNTAEKSTTDDSASHLAGLELMVRPTLGGAGSTSLVQAGPNLLGNTSRIFDGSATPYGATYGIGGQIGFRFHPLVSGGLRGDLATVSASSVGDGSSALTRSRQSAGLYLRAYPLALNGAVRNHVDPWIATGITYMHDVQSFHMPIPTTRGGTVDSGVKLEHHGIGIPLSIGVDYRLTRFLSVGPSFEYTFLAPIAGCASRSVDGFEVCSGGNGAASKAVIAESTGAWTAGLDIRFTPF